MNLDFKHDKDLKFDKMIKYRLGCPLVSAGFAMVLFALLSGYFVIWMFSGPEYMERIDEGFVLFQALISALGFALILLLLSKHYSKRTQGLQLELEETRRSLKNEVKSRAILLAEVHHRVKNNLQVISSILRFQTRESESAAASELLEECQNRILSISMVHDQLYRSESLSAIDMDLYIRRLTGNLADSYNVRNVRMEVIKGGIQMQPARAIPCGLIVNELLANSLKAILTLQPEDSREGVIEVKLAQVSEGNCNLSVRADREGLISPTNIDNPKNLGFRIVGLLISQLNARLEAGDTEGNGISITFSNEEN